MIQGGAVGKPLLRPAWAAWLVTVLAGPLPGQGWQGFTDRNAELKTAAYDFGAAGGGNENYYDGDMGDFDGDGAIDRALISRYGLLHNLAGGVMAPVSTQKLGRPPNSSPSPTGYLFGDEVAIGNDAVQWADIDGDGDLDSIQGGNGEPFTVQANRRGRFSIKKKYSGSALNIVSIDLERDGDVDLAAAHSFCSDALCGHGCPEQNCQGGSWPKEFHLWVNDGTGNFTDQAVQRGLNLGADLIVGIAAGDVDGDRDFDLLLLDGVKRGILLARNDGRGYFSTRLFLFKVPVRPIGPISSGFNQGMNLGDIDDDGDLDLVCALDRDVGTHPRVGHAVFVNDGAGNFAEESDLRFDTGAYTGFLLGGNGKLMDADHDGDLDFLAFDRGKNFFHLFLNDGAGSFSFAPAYSRTFPGQATALGNDTDVTDLDGDGTYDLWVGSAATIVHPLINTYRSPDGLPADVPRDLRVVSGAGGTTLAFRAPSFAATARHYRVYRGMAPGIAPRDRLLLKTVAISPHEDEGFSAPITHHTTTEYLGDADVRLDGEEVRFTDRTALPGITYHYSVSHVGTENTASRPTGEVAGRVEEAPPDDETDPSLDILSPDSQWWSPYPRIVIQYADGGSSIDLESLRVSFDVPIGSGDPASGGRPAGADLSDLFQRKDGGAFVLALAEGQALPQGLATLSARVGDRSGRTTVREVRVNIDSPASSAPRASITAEPTEGDAPLDVSFSGAGSMDPDGLVARWEWYFGDGREALGREATHRFSRPGTYRVLLLVRDHGGAVGTAVLAITVRGEEPVSPPFRRADANCDGRVNVADASHSLEWLFLGGQQPCCLEGADADSNGKVNLVDPVFTLFWLFLGGFPPADPGPSDCGRGPRPPAPPDCEAYPRAGC